MAGVTTSPPSAPEGRLRRLPATLCIRNHTATAGCSKAPQGLLSPTEVCGLFVHIMWLHRAAGGDNGAPAVPFIPPGNYPARHLGSLRESEFLPAFSGLYPGGPQVLGTATGQDTEAIRILSD